MQLWQFLLSFENQNRLQVHENCYFEWFKTHWTKHYGKKRILPWTGFEPGPPDPKSTAEQMCYHDLIQSDTSNDIYTDHKNYWWNHLAFFKGFGYFEAIKIQFSSGESWDWQPLLRFFKSGSVFLYDSPLLRYLTFYSKN